MNSPIETSHCASHWQIEPGVTYLNNGSFGPSPDCVIEARREWSDRLERQPMDFFVRQLEGHLDAACAALGDFLGADPNDVVFTDNATFGMNVVASSTPLQPGDEVLVTDHEYGAVMRIWRRACKNAGAELATVKLPFPLTDQAAVVDAVMQRVTEKTKMIVVSHVTSPTAVILPVEEICRRARERGVPVCIDGPHAVAMLPINFNKIDCDYYTASCHKWLCAPFGSGFLYVAKRRQQHLEPTLMSWGGSLSGRPVNWKDEYRWMGTRDPAVFLAVPKAIEFLQQCGLEEFRKRSHAMAGDFRQRMTQLTGLEPFLPDSREWYGSMVAVPLPPGDGPPAKHGRGDVLQNELWEKHRIEIPVVDWHGRRLIRISCHWYNSTADIDRLMDALQDCLPVR